MKEQRSIKLDEETIQEIEKIAESEQRSFAQVVRLLCKEAIEDRKAAKQL